MLSPSALRALVDAHPALRSLRTEELDTLGANASERDVEAGAALFREGETGVPLMFVVRGHVRIARVLPTGQQLTLYRLGPGDLCVVSAACVFAGRPALATGCAEDDASVVTLPAPLVSRLVARCDELRRDLFEAIATRTAALFALLDDVVNRSLDERLAALLLARGRIVRATHQTLADELGTAREVVSRILEGFAARGLVRLARGRIEVVSRPGLRQVIARSAGSLPAQSPGLRDSPHRSLDSACRGLHH